ncbi:D-glycero-alpha-D-manno-heptose-1,7-bisphosphate 7-phosphatase [Virgibacillus sp. W0430]|uniref:D-glycero-alpha-D-manno-heptose-1,7-bisphosphate 7-phosphatase n=1 Tax=Virgibacillus sp. W0430 TaxID=3391580 RepID=UPI003F4800B9
MALNKAIFLDRDGVINEVLSERVKFVNKPEDLYLIEGVGEAIQQFNAGGYKVFVVTNQGGIGLGYMSEAALKAVHEHMLQQLAQYDARIDAIAYCPHKPHADCICRKPKPEMLLKLAKEHNINLSQSYMVGDRAVDIEAGRLACTQTVLIGERTQSNQYDLYFKDLLAFSNWLFKK